MHSHLLAAFVASADLKRRIPVPPPLSAFGPAPATVFVGSAVGGAAQVVLTWDAVTTKFDGTVLPGGEISHYLVRRYSTAGVLQGSAIGVGNVVTYTHTQVAAGTWDYTVSCVSSYGEGEESFRYRVTVT